MRQRRRRGCSLKKLANDLHAFEKCSQPSHWAATSHSRIEAILFVPKALMLSTLISRCLVLFIFFTVVKKFLDVPSVTEK